MQVSYKTEISTCISLQVPIDSATNLEAIQDDLRGIKRLKKADENGIIPHVTLNACFSNFFQQETLSDYFSAFINGNTQVCTLYV